MRRWPDTVTTEYIPEQEVRESGLLAYINRAVLWPLGMALTVYIEDDGTYQDRLRIQRNHPMDPIVGDGGNTAAITEAQMRTFADWLADRLAAPPSDPAAPLDVERLRDAIYAVSVRHDWANTVDTEDRTEEIAREYAALATPKEAHRE